MKKAKIILGIIVCLALAGCAAYGIYTQIGAVKFGEIIIDGIPEKGDDSTRVMSFNLRCANDGEQTITNRSKVSVALLEQYAPDSFGVQECTPRWKRILAAQLGDKYASVGKPRDFYGPFTEYSSVYYLKDKYNLIDSGTIWLSETPDKMFTKSFDSSCYRIAVWAVLENKETGERYTHFNTHLDHVKESTRDEQIKVLINKLNELKEMGYAIVCTGDFNAYEDSNVYALMSDALNDTKLVAETTDDGATFTSYGKITEPRGKGAIDFIFTSDDIKVDTYKIIRNTVQGIYPSDHFPIVADIVIK